MRRIKPGASLDPAPSAALSPAMLSPAGETHTFGGKLRWWREHRGHSQLDLALSAGSSQRHLSFLESGRTTPSREMVLRLASVLDVPLRQQNALLLAAGFAPAWSESAWSAPELAQVNAALGHMLAQQEPFPALVVDRRWNLLRANRGVGALMRFLAEPGDPAASGSVSLAEALLSPGPMRRSLRNWEEVALYFLRGVQADAVADGTPETADLFKRLLSIPGLPSLFAAPGPEMSRAPVLTLHFEHGGIELRLFTAIATLGTPHDVTLQELRIETFFPADDATAQRFRSWAQAASS